MKMWRRAGAHKVYVMVDGGRAIANVIGKTTEVVELEVPYWNGAALRMTIPVQEYKKLVRVDRLPGA